MVSKEWEIWIQWLLTVNIDVVLSGDDKIAKNRVVVTVANLVNKIERLE